MRGDIDWQVTVTAKLPGQRAYVKRSPTEFIDMHSASNCGYWAENEVDEIRRLYPGAKIIRIEMRGTLR